MISLTRAVEAIAAADRHQRVRSAKPVGSVGTASPAQTHLGRTVSQAQNHSGGPSTSTSTPRHGSSANLVGASLATAVFGVHGPARKERRGAAVADARPAEQPIRLPGRVSTHHTAVPESVCVHCGRLLLGDSRWVTRLLRKASDRKRKNQTMLDVAEQQKEEERRQMALAAKHYPERIARGRDAVIWPFGCRCRFHWECLIQNMTVDCTCPSCGMDTIRIGSPDDGTQSKEDEEDACPGQTAQILCGIISPDADEQHPILAASNEETNYSALKIDILPYLATQFGLLGASTAGVDTRAHSTAASSSSPTPRLPPTPEATPTTAKVGLSGAPLLQATEDQVLLEELRVRFLGTCYGGNVVDVANQVRTILDEPDFAHLLPQIIRSQVRLESVQLEPAEGGSVSKEPQLSSPAPAAANGQLLSPTTPREVPTISPDSRWKMMLSGKAGKVSSVRKTSASSSQPRRTPQQSGSPLPTPISPDVGSNLSVKTGSGAAAQSVLGSFSSVSDANTDNDPSKRRPGKRRAKSSAAAGTSAGSSTVPEPVLNGQSALHLAIGRGLEDLVWMLLLLGTDIPLAEFPERTKTLLRERMIVPPGMMSGGPGASTGTRGLGLVGGPDSHGNGVGGSGEAAGPVDIRAIQDDAGTTAVELAKKRGGVWAGWEWQSILAPPG